MKRKWRPTSEWIDFLGFKVASPLGVPAGPLLNSNWISLAGRLGFDIVTYKTIRSDEFQGHPLPNIIYVDSEEISKSICDPEYGATVSSSEVLPKKMSHLAITNSFGMPSKSREFLKEDIPRANTSLQDGQVMIVSVVGTSRHSGDKSQDALDFIKDFAETALFAKECGAKIIEANFSCPNVTTGEGSIYQNPSSVLSIADAIVRSIGEDVPLIIKVGTYKDITSMKDTFTAATKAKVKGICGINSVSMNVISSRTKLPALGANRLTSGICGAPILPAALHFVKCADEVIAKEQLPLTLMACGGATEPQHFDEMLHAGAKVAMSATGMMWDPYLAARYHQR